MRPSRNSGHQSHEIGEVASVQRQILDLLLFYIRRHRGRNRIDLRNIGFHGYGLLSLSYLKREIHDSLLSDRQCDATTHHGLEALSRSLHFIIADGKIGYGITALAVGGYLLGLAGADIFDLDGSIRDDGAAGIAHGP